MTAITRHLPGERSEALGQQTELWSHSWKTVDGDKRILVTNELNISPKEATRIANTYNKVFGDGFCKVASPSHNLKGVHLQIEDRNGNSPLHLACIHNDEKLVHLLLTFGADVTMQNGKGETPLHIATSKSYSSLARKLMARPEVNLNAQNLLGETPFFLAAANGDVDLMEELVLRGANPSIQNHDGDTALHIAAEQNWLRTLHRLLQLPKTAFNTTRGQNPLSILHKLLQLMPKADIDITNKSGRTAYLCAYLHQSHEAAKVLSAYGADVGYAQEYLLRVQLAHVWNIGGTSELTLKGKGKQVIALEGFSQPYLFPSFMQYVNSFFTSDITEIKILKPHFEKIIQSLTTSYPACRQTSSAIITKMSSKLSHVIFAGTHSHAISMVVSLHHNLLLIGNRDDKTHAGIQIYQLPKSGVSEEMLERLETLKTIEAFGETLQKLNVTHIGKIQLPEQEVGNCTWVSQELAFLMLIFCELHGAQKDEELREVINPIYNKFLAHCAEEEIKKYLKVSRNIDRPLLRKISSQLQKKTYFDTSQKVRIGCEIERILKGPEIVDVVSALSKL
jgi:rhodanese-related sulfurtransferase